MKPQKRKIRVMSSNTNRFEESSRSQVDSLHLLQYWIEDMESQRHGKSLL